MGDIKKVILILILLVFSGCGGGSSSSNTTSVKSSNVSGLVQKGPFLQGSIVTAYKLNNGIRSNTEKISTTTDDNKGSFNLVVPWSGPTEYEIKGQYLDENTGSYLNNGTLVAIVDIVNGSTKKVNINIFTHIAASHIKEMLKNNMNILEAKEESTQKIKEMFSLDLSGDTQLEELDLTDGIGSHKGDNTQLLKISAAVLNSNNSDDTLEKLTQLISIDGEVNNDVIDVYSDILEKADEVDLSNVHNILENKIGASNAPKDNTREGELPFKHGLAFDTKVDVFINKGLVSNYIVVNNLNGSARLTILEGQYSLNDSGFTNVETRVNNGDRIKVKHYAVNKYSSEKTTTLKIGVSNITFKSITKPDPSLIITTPNQFSFPIAKNIQVGNVAVSKEILISGLSDGVLAKVGVTNGASYKINNGEWKSNTYDNELSFSSVVNGDVIKVSKTASSSNGAKSIATLTVGGVSADFIVFTRQKDIRPDLFSPKTLYEVELDSVYETKYFTTSGYEGGLDIKVTNGEVQLEGESVWLSRIPQVPTGYKVKFRQTSAKNYGASNKTVIEFGKSVIDFETITKTDPSVISSIPKSIIFKTKFDKDIDSFVESEERIITGMHGTATYAYPSEGTQISINGQEWTTEPVSITLGTRVKLKMKTGLAYNKRNIRYIYYGPEKKLFARFDVFTKKKDIEIDDIDFSTKEDVKLDTYFESNIVTISGITSPSCANIINGEFKFNGNDWTSSTSKICFQNGQTLQLRHKSSIEENTSIHTIVSFDTKQYEFKTTTSSSPQFLNKPRELINQNSNYEFTPKVRDNHTLTFSLSSKPTWMSINTQTGEITGIPSQSDIGQSDVITLLVKSSSGLEKSLDFKVTVNDINDAPILSNTWNSQTIDEYSNYSKSASATDIEGGELTWSLENNPSWLSINPQSGELTGTPKQADVGIKENIKVIVKEEAGLKSSFVFNMTVIDKNKNAFIYDISNKTAFENDEVVINVNAYDSDGDTLIFEINNIPSWLSFNSLTKKLSGTPSSNDIGEYKNISISVTDGHGSKMWTYFDLEVKVKKVVPSITPITLSISETTNINTLIGTLGFDNGNSPILSMSLSGEGSNKFEINKNGEILLKEKVSFSEKPQYILKVKAQNDIGESPEVNLTINVLEITPLDNMDFNVQVKSSQSKSTGLNSHSSVTIKTNPTYGTAQAFLVGNESWSISYENNSCFVGNDSFIFEQDGALGTANVTITADIIEAVNKNFEVLNIDSLKSHIIMPSQAKISAIIKSNPSNGTALIKEINGNIVFDYTPNKKFTGLDSFVYSIVTDINGCTYTKDGTITIKVKGIDPEVTTLTNPVFRTILQDDLPNQVLKYAYDVAIEDNIIAISSPYKQHNDYASSGEVIIYKKVNDKIEEIQRIKSPNISNDDAYARFAYSISLKDDYLAVSSFTYYKYLNNHYYRSNKNKVFVYKKNSNDTFTHIGTVNSISNDSESMYAKKVIINKNYLVVGSSKEDHNSLEDSGLAYVYPIVGDSVSSSYEIIANDTPIKSERFAYELSFVDNMIAVGAPYSKAYIEEGDNNVYGQVFLYGKNKNDEFELKNTIKPDRSIKSTNSYSSFAWSLHSDGQLLAIGAKGAKALESDNKSYGAVFVYTKKGDGSFVLVSKVVDENKMENAQFGKRVAIEDNYLLVHSEYSKVVNYSDMKNVYGFTHIYQYIGNSEYKRVKRVSSKKAYSGVHSKYKEKPNLGYSLDISNGTIVSGAPDAIVKTPLNTVTFAGRAYLMEVAPSLKPYLIQNKFYQEEGGLGFSAYWSEDNDNVSLSGEDASLFNTDIIYGNTNFISLSNNENPDMQDEVIPNEVLFDYPQDSDNNNIYEMNINLNKDNQNYSYPIKVYVRDRLDVKISTDTSASSSDRYKNYPIGESGITSFAKSIKFGTNKVYANAKGKIYVYNRKDRDSNDIKFLEYDSSISLVHRGTEARPFDAEDNLLVTQEQVNISSSLNDEQYENYLNVYINKSISKRILFSRNTTDRDKTVLNSTTQRHFKYIKDIKLDESRILVQYQNSIFEKNDIDDDTDNFNNHKAGIRVYTKSSNDEYTISQDLVIAATPETQGVMNQSFINGMSVDNGYLVLTFNINSSTNKSIKVYKFNSSSNKYEYFQAIEDSNISYINIKGSFLTIKSKKASSVDYAEVYKLNENKDEFIKVDTLFANDAGANNITYFNGVKTDGNYLFFRFTKLIDVRDASYSTNMYSNTSYIAVFKFDESLNKYKFMRNINYKGSSTNFASEFEVDNNEIIANNGNISSDSGQLYMFRFKEKE